MPDYALICVDPADDGPFLTLAHGRAEECEAMLSDILAHARALKLRVMPGRGLGEVTILRRAPIGSRGQASALHFAIVLPITMGEALTTMRATLAHMAS